MGQSGAEAALGGSGGGWLRDMCAEEVGCPPTHRSPDQRASFGQGQRALGCWKLGHRRSLRGELTCLLTMSLKSWHPQSKTKRVGASEGNPQWGSGSMEAPLLSSFLPPLASEAELTDNTWFLHRCSCIFNLEESMDSDWGAWWGVSLPRRAPFLIYGSDGPWCTQAGFPGWGH
nr:putative uncharacterized protein BAALC-AS2 [Pan troglodytes]